MKKIIIPIIAFMIILVPVASAQYTGLVKCDGVVLPTDPQGKKRCDFVALVEQIQFLIKWGMGMLLAIAVVVAAYTGIMYMVAGFNGDVSKANKAREQFTNIFWGILIVLFAWLIVRTLLNWLVDTSVYKFDLLDK